MNLLNMAVIPSMYTHYSAGKAYPQDMYPFLTMLMKYPILPPAPTTTNLLPQRFLHAILHKTRNNVVNMNAVLINTLLSLIPTVIGHDIW